MLLIIAGILEFILSNTFPFIVFMGYGKLTPSPPHSHNLLIIPSTGAHFLTYGTTFIPFYNAVAALAPTDSPSTQTPEFLASYGFYALAMAILSFVFLLCSLRTNAVFVLVFLGATIGFGLASGAFWQLALANLSLGSTLLVGAGGAFFGATMAGWYMFLAVMLAIMDLPSLPIFDLSTRIKGVSERAAAKAGRHLD